MSTPLKDAALRYPPIDKQAYVLVRAVKKFRHYILRSPIVAIVSDATIKNLLAQHELGEKRGNWVSALQEYDLLIQPMKIVRGQGLTQTLALCGNVLDPEFIKTRVGDNDIMICQYLPTKGSWYEDITRYLTSGTYPR